MSATLSNPDTAVATPPRLLRRTATLLLAAAAMLMAGCATTAPIADVTNVRSDPLGGRTIAVRTGSTPSFYADTPERRVFGLFGVMAMMRSGNQLVETYGLKDPAALVSQELAAALADGNRMSPAPADRADLLLDVQTIAWDFRPYRRDGDNLFVVYAARVTLVDQRSGVRLASGKCRSRRDPGSDSATLDELLADGARRLHDELREAGLECAQRMKRETLSALLGTALPPVAQQQVRIPSTPPTP